MLLLALVDEISWQIRAEQDLEIVSSRREAPR